MAISNKEQANIIQAYQEIFLHTPQGQTILRDLLKASGLFIVAGVRESGELQHMSGAQDMVRRVINLLSLDEDQVLAIALGHVEPIDEGVDTND
tara:strand:- start:1112 stop:1393 length:282 start_codon:yes stop_codon:yes gene_type:complete